MDLTRVAHQQTEVNSIARQDEVKKRTKQSNGYERPKKEIPTLNKFDTLSRLVHDESLDSLCV